MQITHRQLRAFVMVAEAGSFSLASQRLHLSPSAVSLLIRELEGVLDFRLLERTTRHVVLTPAGREFIPSASPPPCFRRRWRSVARRFPGRSCASSMRRWIS